MGVTPARQTQLLKPLQHCPTALLRRQGGQERNNILVENMGCIRRKRHEQISPDKLRCPFSQRPRRHSISLYACQFGVDERPLPGPEGVLQEVVQRTRRQGPQQEADESASWILDMYDAYLEQMGEEAANLPYPIPGNKAGGGEADK